MKSNGTSTLRSLHTHFSGVHEIMIKAAKKAIYVILNCADITDEEIWVLLLPLKVDWILDHWRTSRTIQVT